MPKDATSPGVRRVRKGTKSCIDCRQRKVRCIYSGSSTCDNCVARHRVCVAQGPTSPAPEPPPSSRDRIRHLESEVASLWGVVRRLEQHQGARNSSAPDDSPAVHPSPWRERQAPFSQDAANRSEIVEDNGEDTTDSMSEDLGVSPANQPTHLRQLFDNELLDSRSPQDAPWGSRDHSGHPNSMKHHLNEARRQLQKLIPSREDVASITSFSYPWMSIYFALFPRVHMVASGEELLYQYDELCQPDANPMSIANLLISLSLSVRQITTEDARPLASGVSKMPHFIKEVSETVDRMIVGNDVLAGTLEGIETSLLFVRLTMVSVDVRKMWIRLRRIIALAELIGLPRAAKSLSPEATPTHKSAAAIWESICVVDRLAGMMFNLPCATGLYSSQQASVISEAGTVDVQAYLGRLTEIALSVQDLDNVASSDRNDFEQLPRVFAIDERLRNLANLTPPDWWTATVDTMTPELLVQYWHNYFTVRTHLRLALNDDDMGRYRLSYNTCVSASQSMARRYLTLRPLLPAGFFACRILDIQILTAAVFLLFDANKRARQTAQREASSNDFVDQLSYALEAASQKAGGEFAKKALSALRSLQTLMQAPPGDSSKETILSLPLLGKISVARKMPTTQPKEVHATQTLTGWQQDSFASGTSFAQDDGDYNSNNGAIPFWSIDVVDDFSFQPDMLPDGFGFLDYGMPFNAGTFE